MLYAEPLSAFNAGAVGPCDHAHGAKSREKTAPYAEPSKFKLLVVRSRGLGAFSLCVAQLPSQAHMLQLHRLCSLGHPPLNMLLTSSFLCSTSDTLKACDLRD